MKLAATFARDLEREPEAAASLIYTQAPQIIRAFDEGAVDAGIGAVLEARRSVALLTV